MDEVGPGGGDGDLDGVAELEDQGLPGTSRPLLALDAAVDRDPVDEVDDHVPGPEVGQVHGRGGGRGLAEPAEEGPAKPPALEEGVGGEDRAPEVGEAERPGGGALPDRDAGPVPRGEVEPRQQGPEAVDLGRVAREDEEVAVPPGQPAEHLAEAARVAGRVQDRGGPEGGIGPRPRREGGEGEHGAVPQGRPQPLPRRRGARRVARHAPHPLLDALRVPQHGPRPGREVIEDRPLARPRVGPQERPGEARARKEIEGDPARLLGEGALAGRLEPPHRGDLVPGPLDADRPAPAEGEDVQHASPERPLPGGLDPGHAGEAGRVEVPRQVPGGEPPPGRHGSDRLRQAGGRGDGVQDRGCRGHEEARRRREARQGLEGRDPRRDHPLLPHPVDRVPGVEGGEAGHGRGVLPEEGEVLGEPLGLLRVGADHEDRPALRGRRREEERRRGAVEPAGLRGAARGQGGDEGSHPRERGDPGPQRLQVGR